MSAALIIDIILWGTVIAVGVVVWRRGPKLMTASFREGTVSFISVVPRIAPPLMSAISEWPADPPLAAVSISTPSSSAIAYEPAGRSGMFAMPPFEPRFVWLTLMFCDAGAAV